MPLRILQGINTFSYLDSFELLWHFYEKGWQSMYSCHPSLCFGRDSNPYRHSCPRDFKSLVSTNSTTKAFRSAKLIINSQISIQLHFPIFLPRYPLTKSAVQLPEGTAGVWPAAASWAAPEGTKFRRVDGAKRNSCCAFRQLYATILLSFYWLSATSTAIKIFLQNTWHGREF